MGYVNFFGARVGVLSAFRQQDQTRERKCLASRL